MGPTRVAWDMIGPPAEPAVSSEHRRATPAPAPPLVTQSCLSQRCPCATQPWPTNSVADSLWSWLAVVGLCCVQRSATCHVCWRTNSVLLAASPLPLHIMLGFMSLALLLCFSSTPTTDIVTPCHRIPLWPLNDQVVSLAHHRNLLHLAHCS